MRANSRVQEACGEVESVIRAFALKTYQRLSIISGHYCLSADLSELSHEGAAELASFDFGAALWARLKHRGRRAVLIVFVNDIGLDPANRAGLIDSYQLPDNYRRLLDKHGVPRDTVKVIFESVIRNRASKEISRLKKRSAELFEMRLSSDPQLTRCVDPAAICDESRSHKKAVTIRGADNERLVVKEGGSPKCNAILATLFEQARGATASQVCINCFNAIYINRLRLGVYVHRALFSRDMDMVSLLFDDQGLCATAGCVHADRVQRQPVCPVGYDEVGL